MFVNHQLNIQACLISNCHLILSGPGQSYLIVITIIIQSITVLNCTVIVLIQSLHGMTLLMILGALKISSMFHYCALTITEKAF